MASERLDIIIGAKDKASGVIKGIGGALGGLGKMAGTLAKFGAVGLGATVAAVTGLSVAVGKLADQGAQLQGIEDAFKGFAGDQAGSLLKNMQDLSKGMITQTDLMKNYNTAAQLVGKEFADRLPEALQYLGKVAAATGQDMGYMMSSLVTGIGRESKMILDNLGITVKEMNELLKEEAERLGISEEGFKEWEASLTEAQRKAILTNHVFEQLAKNTANLKEAVNPIQQLKTGFKDLGDTFKKSVFKAIMPFLEKFVPRMVELLDLFGRFVFLKDPFEDTISEVNKLPKPLRTFFNIAREVFRFFETLFSRGLEAAFSQVGATIRNAIGDEAYNRFIGFINIGKRVVEWVRGTLIPWLGENIPKAIDFLKTKWGELSTAVSTAWNWIQENVIPKIETLWSWLQDKIPVAIDWLSDKWENVLSPAIGKAWDWIQLNVFPKIEALWTWLKQKVPEAIDYLSGKWDELRPKLEENITKINEGLQPAWEELKEYAEKQLGPQLIKLRDQFFSLLPAMTLTTDATNNQTNGWKTLFGWLVDIYKILSALAFVVVQFATIPLQMLVWWLGQANNAIRGIAKLLGKGGEMPNALDESKSWVDKLTDAIYKLADALSYLTLPGLLRQKSPSPFAKSLIEINEELDKMVGGFLPQLNRKLNIKTHANTLLDSTKNNPMINRSVPAYATARGNAPIIYLTYSPAVSLADRAEVETKLVPLIDNAMRRVKRGKV